MIALYQFHFYKFPIEQAVQETQRSTQKCTSYGMIYSIMFIHKAHDRNIVEHGHVLPQVAFGSRML